MVDEPTCNGTTTYASPSISGNRNRNVAETLWNVKTWNSVSAPRTFNRDVSTFSTATS